MFLKPLSCIILFQKYIIGESFEEQLVCNCAEGSDFGNEFQDSALPSDTEAKPNSSSEKCELQFLREIIFDCGLVLPNKITVRLLKLTTKHKFRQIFNQSNFAHEVHLQKTFRGRRPNSQKFR